MSPRTKALSGSLIILALLLPFSSVSAANTVYWLGAKSQGVTNSGIETTMQVQSINVANGDCLSFWVSDSEFSNGYWGQIGWFSCSGSQIVAFYQIWDLNNYSVITAGDTTASPGMHTFTMAVQTGTIWSFALDGSVFGIVDFKTNSLNLGYPIYVMSEEQAPSPFVFPQQSFSTAMNVQVNGQWQPVSSASVYSAGGATWGIKGNSQDSTIPKNTLQMGDNLPNLGSNTQLWTNAAFTMTQTTSSTTSSATTTSSTTVTTTGTGAQVTGTYIAFVNNGGQPVPGVSAMLEQGNAILASGISNSGGQIAFSGFSVPAGSTLEVVSQQTNYNGITYLANTYTYVLNNVNQFNADYLKGHTSVCTSGCLPPPSSPSFPLTADQTILVAGVAALWIVYHFRKRVK